MANILFAGDYCPHARVSDLIEEEKYEDIFYDVRTIINESDYSIVNFETTIANEQIDTPIIKCGEALCTSEKALNALQYVGFKCYSLANNHFNDYERKGIEECEFHREALLHFLKN